MNRIEKAVSLFDEGFNCSQSVFCAFAVEMGVERDVALKMAQGFGGGMGLMGETCGAVTGAFMVIGLKYGRTSVDDDEAKRKTYELIKIFATKFKAKHGTILCRELLGCNIGTPRGKEYAEEKALTTTICPGFVRDAAEILEMIL